MVSLLAQWGLWSWRGGCTDTPRWSGSHSSPDSLPVTSPLCHLTEEYTLTCECRFHSHRLDTPSIHVYYWKAKLNTLTIITITHFLPKGLVDFKKGCTLFKPKHVHMHMNVYVLVPLRVESQNTQWKAIVPLPVNCWVSGTRTSIYTIQS